MYTIQCNPALLKDQLSPPPPPPREGGIILIKKKDKVRGYPSYLLGELFQPRKFDSARFYGTALEY